MSHLWVTILRPLILVEFIEPSMAVWFTHDLKWTLTVVLANIITNPFLNASLALYRINIGTPAWYVIFAGEVIVTVFEAYFYKCLTDEPFGKCVFLSVILNLMSFSAGLFL